MKKALIIIAAMFTAILGVGLGSASAAPTASHSTIDHQVEGRRWLGHDVEGRKWLGHDVEGRKWLVLPEAMPHPLDTYTNPGGCSKWTVDGFVHAACSGNWSGWRMNLTVKCAGFLYTFYRSSGWVRIGPYGTVVGAGCSQVLGSWIYVTYP